MLLPLLFAVVIAQADTAPTPVPNPVPQLSALEYFKGTWSCHQMLRGKDRPDTFTSTMDMNDRWIKTTDVAPPFDKYRTLPVNSISYMTYDSTVKRYVQLNVDDFGGYGVAYSPGWAGNTLIWTDKSASDGSVGIVTIAKVGEAEYDWNFKGTGPHGKPQPPQNGNCKKTS